MTPGKAARSSDIITEMLKPLRETRISEMHDLVKDIISSSQIFAFQLTGMIAASSICAWGKAGTLHSGKYRCLKQIKRMMTVLEHDEKG